MSEHVPERGGGGDGFVVGDRVIDAEDDTPSAAEVVDLPGTTADEHAIEGMSKTVAAFNPDYPADDPVVGVQFVKNGAPSGTTYHYPASRLEQVGDDWVPEPSKTPAQREREQLIEENRMAFEGFRHAAKELAYRPERSSDYLLEQYKKQQGRHKPTTRGECQHSREDDYRPDDPDAIVCWECNGGGRRPNKLQAGDDVPTDAPCSIKGFPNPKRAFKDWYFTMLVEGNASRVTPHPAESEKSIEPNPDFHRLHWTAKDLADDKENFRRSAIVRIGYEATLGGLLDEEYNHSRARAYLRDLGVDTNALLPGGDPHVETGGGESQ